MQIITSTNEEKEFGTNSHTTQTNDETDTNRSTCFKKE